jgi:prolyl-tRNA editing enzyme YbaK/EbsC (Cys-tRNA(Pro) deacylase)
LSSSVERVKVDALRLGLDVKIVELSQGTRTAVDAAIAARCLVDQIVKSIVFRAQGGAEHFLFLTAGNHQIDLHKATALAGTALEKADAESIREATGFAIGGVSPLGHVRAIRTWMDPHLLDFEVVWAAAGTPNHVFSVSPNRLQAEIACDVANFVV